MVPVTIYTREGCGYCVRAKALLNKKGAAFTEIDAGSDPALKAEMVQRSGRMTFPQIFLGTTHVGGCDDLYALDAEGRLDGLLAG
ncbi:glutaredoxin 3 [Pleomorphomonas diazotrophica]|uniref:Glutaredoxin n=1 Tax=Pleomorphomonas diazotrophica TaxID=1166257 RepID=A0A1I4RI89_9HYPH|nr:glutaredoxin 3 [Pleomorphomonas diazotrophica]PKR87555.1 glutaredoxin 3 [Pleomorphomonas diazotrophica]SFM51937.1 glutaredoxin 3 [Pleomorphomonas diazotrophica]